MFSSVSSFVSLVVSHLGAVSFSGVPLSVGGRGSAVVFRFARVLPGAFSSAAVVRRLARRAGLSVVVVVLPLSCGGGAVSVWVAAGSLAACPSLAVSRSLGVSCG